MPPSIRPLRKPRSQHRVRHAGPRTGWRAWEPLLFRIAVYAILGVALEVVFYNLVKFGRGVPGLQYLFLFDWRVDRDLSLQHVWDVPLRSLFGQCSLWMAGVYAVACLAIEQLYQKLFTVPLPLRAVAYGLTIFLWECASGWLLLWATGYRIWYYADAGAFFEMTSWFILPLWCLTGLIVEYLYRQLMDPDLVKAIEDVRPDPEFKP